MSSCSCKKDKKHHKGGDCCEKKVVTDCISCVWAIPKFIRNLVGNSTIIYEVKGLCPSASGKIEFCTIESPTNAPAPTGNIFVTVEFLRCGSVAAQETLFCGSCLAFTVDGFDAIRITRPTSLKDFNVIGEICITPNFCEC